MRISIINQSSRPDSIIFSLAEFAAKFFPHRTGIVTITVKNSRETHRGCGAHGVCHNRNRCTIWVEPPGKELTYPLTFGQMHYFRHANHDCVKILHLDNWAEHCLSIMAHEMEHTTASNQVMRRSMQEIHAWNRSVEVVEAFKKPENQLLISEKVMKIESSTASKKEKNILAKSPEAKRLNCETLLVKWVRKKKSAETRIQKLKAKIRYFEKRESIAAQKKSS